MYRLATMHSVKDGRTDRRHYNANSRSMADHTACSKIE